MFYRKEVPEFPFILYDMRDGKLFTGYFAYYTVRKFFKFWYDIIYTTLENFRPGRIIQSLQTLLISPVRAWRYTEQTLEKSDMTTYELYVALSESGEDFYTMRED